MLFPVQQNGNFFSFCPFFFRSRFLHFLTKKEKNEKKERFCVRPTGHNSGHPLHRKLNFKGGLRLACPRVGFYIKMHISACANLVFGHNLTNIRDRVSLFVKIDRRMERNVMESIEYLSGISPT